MKLIKKITQKRAFSLPEFKQIQEKFNEIKLSSKTGNGISRVEDISELNFFLVLEYVDLVDKIDYEKIFPKNDHNVDIESLLDEQEKIISYLNKKNKNFPDYFKNLGITNEITGCFLIATRKTDVKNVSSKNTINTISLKLNFMELPAEFKKLCLDYNTANADEFKKEQQSFERFLKLSFEEEDMILQNILYSAVDKSIVFCRNEKSQNNKRIEKEEEYFFLSGETLTKADTAFNENIDRLTNIPFLSSLLAVSERNEKYEICAKIRDRILFLQENK